MRLFGKGQKVLPESQVHLAQRIAGRILQSQRTTADYLNARTAGISLRSWRMILIAFCLLFGGYSLYLLLESIY